MRLIPKTHKGKNKIREAGTDQWEIIRESENCPCFDGAPGILIAPRTEDRTFAENKSRWVRRVNDSDFDFQES